MGKKFKRFAKKFGAGVNRLNTNVSKFNKSGTAQGLRGFAGRATSGFGSGPDTNSLVSGFNNYASPNVNQMLGLNYGKSEGKKKGVQIHKKKSGGQEIHIHIHK